MTLQTNYNSEEEFWNHSQAHHQRRRSTSGNLKISTSFLSKVLQHAVLFHFIDVSPGFLLFRGRFPALLSRRKPVQYLVCGWRPDPVPLEL